MRKKSSFEISVTKSTAVMSRQEFISSLWCQEINEFRRKTKEKQTINMTLAKSKATRVSAAAAAAAASFQPHNWSINRHR